MRLQILFYILLTTSAFGSDSLFIHAYNQITGALQECNDLSFEDAVFLVENAYMDGELSKDVYSAFLDTNEIVIRKIEQMIFLPDSINVIGDSMSYRLNYSIFKRFTQSTLDIDTYTYYYSYQYNRIDPLGDSCLSNNFVSTLINPLYNSGNCKSLAYLYYIFAQRLDCNAWLSIVPNHIFVQIDDETGRSHNVDLSSGTFPQNGVIRAVSGTSNLGVQSGVYLSRLTGKQLLSMLLVDLGVAYQKKNDIVVDGFVLKCSKTAYSHDPLNVNAKLLQVMILAEMYKSNQDEKKQEKALIKEMLILKELGYQNNTENNINRIIQTSTKLN